MTIISVKNNTLKFPVFIYLLLTFFSSQAQIAAEEDNTNGNGTYTSFYQAYKNIHDVKIVSLKKDSITSFLLNANTFTSLEELHLFFGRTNIDFTPLLEIPSLTNLSIDYTSNVILPDKLYTLKHLKNITLTHDNILFLPKDFFANSTIQVINLEGNNIKILPDFFADTNIVKTLSLKNNHLNELPDNFYKLDKLEFLNISTNEFSTFPDEILKLKNLKILNIGFNNISALPLAIDALKSIETIYLIQTNIKALPKTFKNLKSLKHLLISELSLTDAEKKKIIKQVPKQCKITWTNNDYYHDLDFTRELK